jgi:nuclear transport factor 2 (NTF2) superfamily protein
MAGTKLVEFVLEMLSAAAANIAGTFNNWDPDKLSPRKGKDGRWRTRVRVPGGRQECRLIVDGQWMSDPKAGRAQPNAFGSSNSVLEV